MPPRSPYIVPFWAIAILTYLLILVLNRTLDPSAMNAMVSENGAIELAQWLVITAALALAAQTYAVKLRGTDAWPLFKAWMVILALGSLYISGEEVSWGQWFFEWSTPETMKALNDQQETNFHNISSWLDQKPRALIEVGVILGGIVWPLLLMARPALATWRFALFMPSVALLPTAVLAEWTKLPDRAEGLFRGDAPLTALDLARPSEVQELFFFLFILLYLMDLRRRIPAHLEARRAKAAL